jgi:hypothetical protein
VRRVAAVGALAVLAAASVVGARIASTSGESGSSGDSTSAIAGPSLESVLIQPEVLDVPTDWTIRDLDPSLAADDELLAEMDPYLQLLRCPAGALREGPDRQWRARQFAAPELPLENGLLSVELIIEVESDEQWQDDRSALDDCDAGEQSLLTVADMELAIEGEPEPPDAGEAVTVPMTAIELLSSPSSAVPYPSAFNAAVVHLDDRTVSVILGGVDMGESYQRLAEQIAVILLATPSPPADES